MSRFISLPTFPKAISRRHFLKGAIGGGLLVGASPALADFTEYRSVSFVHAQTGETLEANYFRHGTYHATTMARVAFLMRDFHSGDIHGIDPMLLDALFELKVRADFDHPYQMISGYRSPLTNSNCAKTRMWSPNTACMYTARLSTFACPVLQRRSYAVWLLL